MWLVLERFFPYSILRISDEVSSAVRDGKPVVALESAIITHGMPYPINLEWENVLSFCNCHVCSML